MATSRNQSVWMRSRGRLIDDRKRKTKKTGNIPWTASPEPVRSAMKRPMEPNPIAMRVARATITRTPRTPAAKLAPAATPTMR